MPDDKKRDALIKSRGRRNFIKGLGAAGAAGALMLLGAKAPFSDSENN